MADYRVPFQAAESEFTEKRSRFIGRIWRVGSETEARIRIEETKKQFYDARHHCWCYLLHGGPIRYSDDGEPQGTAGQPILNVLERRGVADACCIVTRYFGGILLGAGGLTRAYARSAADVLEAAGTCQMCRWTRWEVPCTYPLYERLKGEIAAAGGRVEDTVYGGEILLRAAFPENGAERFAARLRELSAGSLSMTEAGETLLPGPRDPF